MRALATLAAILLCLAVGAARADPAPNGFKADLSVVLTRNSVLTQNQAATYTVSVGNGGPKTETGPVVVAVTLPPQLAYLSASGSGWSCGAAGQIVTCSNSSALAARASLPPITLQTLVTGTGTLTVAASVSGQLTDNKQDNNSSSDTSTVVVASSAYAFTDSACASGFAFGSVQQTCKALSGQPIVAGVAAPVFVTALSAGVPTALSKSADTTVKMVFAISCINPTSDAGIKARYAGTDLQLCVANGNAPGSGSIGWSSMINMVFPSGAASVVASAAFSYADVGKIQLYLRDTNGNSASSVPFVVTPASLEIVSVTRNADGLANPAAATGADPGFAKVGEAFTVRAAARTGNATRDVAPNFGREAARLVLDSQPGGDAAVQAAMVNVTGMAGDFTSVTAGVFTGSAFAATEVGIMALTPRLDNDDYLGTGAPPSVTVNVGRFFPDHFDTQTAAPMQCLPHMACPSTVSGAANSGQAFTVTVKPMSADGALLSNFNGVLARDITLGAYTDAGATSQYPSTYVLSNATIPAAAIAPGLATGNPVFALPQPFSSAAPRARNWTAPSAIYLRATANDNTASGNVTISSLRADAAASSEGGVTILSGRLALDNPHGSELMKMPVRAQAQYWTTGGRWETSATDNASTLLTGGIAFANCRLALGPPCKAVLGVTAATQQTLQDGVTTFWLKAPGSGNNGSAEFQMNNPAWLPTTIGRAVFGVYKSPLIYMREVY